MLNPTIPATARRMDDARAHIDLPAALADRLDRIASINEEIKAIDVAAMKRDAVELAKDAGKITDAALTKIAAADLKGEILGSARDALFAEIIPAARRVEADVMDEIRAKVFNPTVEILAELAATLPAGASVDTLTRTGRHDLAAALVKADEAAARLKLAYDLRALFIGTISKHDEAVSKYDDVDAALEILRSDASPTEKVLNLIRAGVGLILPDHDGIASAKRRRQAEFEARREAAIKKIR